MSNLENRKAFDEVLAAGQCCHPIRLRGELLNQSTGEVNPSRIKIACKDRRESVCASCSQRYGTDAWIIAVTGIGGGKGIPESVSQHPRIFVTVTAPSFGRVHTRGNGVCSPILPGRNICQHGLRSTCLETHVADSPLLGTPLCVRCFDFNGAVNWNAYASQLWSKTAQYARRYLAREVGITQRRQAKSFQVHYFKVAEVQQRGLIHFHAIVRLDDFRSGPVKSPRILNGEDLSRAWANAINGTSTMTPLGEVGWGRIYDIRDIGNSLSSTRKTASYLAKYVTKTTGGTVELARRFESIRQIETLVSNRHFRTLAVTTWNMAGDPRYEKLHLDRYANTMGYRGHIITKSRGYSTSFADLRQSRIDFARSEAESDLIVSAYAFDGRGYEHAKSEKIAETFALMQRESRVERMNQRIENTKTVVSTAVSKESE